MHAGRLANNSRPTLGDKGQHNRALSLSLASLALSLSSSSRAAEPLKRRARSPESIDGSSRDSRVHWLGPTRWAGGAKRSSRSARRRSSEQPADREPVIFIIRPPGQPTRVARSLAGPPVGVEVSPSPSLWLRRGLWRANKNALVECARPPGTTAYKSLRLSAPTERPAKPLCAPRRAPLEC